MEKNNSNIRTGQKLEIGNKSTVKINPTKESLKEQIRQSLKEDREMRRLAAQERAAEREREAKRAGVKSHTPGLHAKSIASDYANKETKSITWHDKKTKGKYIPGMVSNEEYVNEGDFWHPDPEQDKKLSDRGAKLRAREDAANKSKSKENPRKLRPGESYMDFAKRHGYKSRTESHVPGKPAEKLGAVTTIPKDERDAARERTLAKAKAARAAREKVKKEEFEIDEAIRNPESRKKLRDIMNTDKGRKGDASKGENPRSKYPSERSKLASHLLHGSGETGSKGNPVRSRGGTNAPADERVGKGPNRAKNAAYWAGNAGPTRDRGAGSKAKRRAAELNKEEFEIEEGKQTFPYKKVAAKIKDKLSRSVYAKTDNSPVPNTTDAERKATTQMSKMARVYNQTKRADQDAAKARRSSTFYRDTHPASPAKMKKSNEETLSFSNFIAELNRYEKETGKDLKTGKPVTKGGTMGGDDKHSQVMRHMHKVMGAGRMGAGGAIQQRGKKKVKGAPTPGPSVTPAQKVAKRDAAAKASQDFMNDTRGT